MWEELEGKILHQASHGLIKLSRVAGPGGPMEIVALEGPPVSLVVPILDDGRIVMVRQYRPVWKKTTWECPAGHAEEGETPEQVAARELEEETGYRARRLTRLCEVRGSAKIANPFTLFSGHDLTPGPPKPDVDEAIEIAAFSHDALRDLVERGEILHAPSLVALLMTLGDKLVGTPGRSRGF